ncbi:MAG: ATP-binding protein [Microcoleaceae cyanobacterium MO_207.B10]|nr:ATP-binding protein [Microcoleaceae cyanobacterium MO_207.B10]
MTKLKGSDQLPTFRKAQLQVISDLEENDKVLSWFEQLHQTPIPKTVWLQCELALAEGFTNAVRYAHKCLPRETPIDIEVTMYTDHGEIRIWDYGPEFDIAEWFQQHPETGIFDPGGRGIKLMYAIADQISYTHTPDNRNCLFISKDYWAHAQPENNINS